MKFTQSRTLTAEGIPDLPVKYGKKGQMFRPTTATLYIYLEETNRWSVMLRGPVVTPRGRLHANRESHQMFNAWDSDTPEARSGLLPDGRSALELFSEKDLEALGSRMLHMIRSITQASEDMWREWNNTTSARGGSA